MGAVEQKMGLKRGLKKIFFEAHFECLKNPEALKKFRKIGGSKEILKKVPKKFWRLVCRKACSPWLLKGSQMKKPNFLNENIPLVKL